MVFASPSYDKKSARDKSKNWNKFIDSLSWENLNKPEKTDAKEAAMFFKSIGVHVDRMKKKKGVK